MKTTSFEMAFIIRDFMEYISIAQAAEKWGLSRRRVLALCSQGRIPGVSRLGTIWMIPSDAEKPADARIKSGKYRGFVHNRGWASPPEGPKCCS